MSSTTSFWAWSVKTISGPTDPPQLGSLSAPIFYAMKHVLFKVKDIDEWRKHCEFLNTMEVIALDTMSFENCVYERCVAFYRDEAWYVVGSAEHSGEPVPADMTIELNQIHKEKLSACLTPLARFEGDFVLPKTCEILYEFGARMDE